MLFCYAPFFADIGFPKEIMRFAKINILDDIALCILTWATHSRKVYFSSRFRAFSVFFTFV